MELESSLTAMDWLPKLSVGQDPSGRPFGPLRAEGDSNSTTPSNGGDLSDVNKPAYSYASLITFAIGSSPEKRMTLSEIYQWIIDKYPYYKDAENGWKVKFCRFWRGGVTKLRYMYMLSNIQTSRLPVCRVWANN